MKRVLFASVLMLCAAPIAVGQFPELPSDPGSAVELRGLARVYVTSYVRDQSVQKKITEVIKKRLPHLNFVSSQADADVWLNLTFEYRYDRYRVPNANDIYAQTASDALYTAHGRVFVVKPGKKLRLVEKFRREGPDQKTLGADFAKDFVRIFEQANVGLQPTRTVNVHQRIVPAEKSPAGSASLP